MDFDKMKKTIDEAEVVIITSGAGMGVDSGKDFSIKEKENY